MTEHPLRKRFPAMSLKGLEIMRLKIIRTNAHQDDPPEPAGFKRFWLFTSMINATARY